MSNETSKRGGKDLSKWRDGFYWRRVVGAKKPETEEGILRALQDQGIEDEEDVALILEEMLKEEEPRSDDYRSPVVSTFDSRNQFNRGGGFH